MSIFPPNNLPKEAQGWGNKLTAAVQQLIQANSSSSNDSNNVNKAQNSTMKVLGNKIANVQAGIQAAVNSITIDASQVVSGTLTRPVTTAGAGNFGPGAFSSLSSAGAVNGSSMTATGGITGADLYTINGPGFNITGGRVTAWLENATGRVGMATSSERYKQAIVNATTDPNAILGISVKYYQYNAEVAKRDDPNSPDYVGPDYHVAVNIGMIAEDLHAAGLWEFVVYQRDADGNLVLDTNGQPIPDGIHYEVFGVAVLIAAQSLNTRLIALEDRVTKLEGNSK